MNIQISINPKWLFKITFLAVFTVAPFCNARAQMPDILNGSGSVAQMPIPTITAGGSVIAKPNTAGTSKAEIGSAAGKSTSPVAGKGLDTIRTASDPTAIYRIGINDVLAIEITSVPSPPKFVKVNADGTIDFPLVGERIFVAGKTPREAASLIAGSIRLVQNPRVALRVRDFASHTITVWGLIDQPGEQQIQRDAVPFFVVRAGANIDSRAKLVRIVRSSSTRTEEYRLSDPTLGPVLIYPGDSIEFSDGQI